MIEGEAKGEVKGLAKGEAKLNQERRTIVKNLLKQGIDIEIIIVSTGFTRREIREIQKEI